MERNEKRASVWTRITAIAVTGIFIVIVVISIGLYSKLAEAEAFLSKIGSAANQLAAISDQISDIDWGALADNISAAAIAAQSGMESAMQTIDELDIRTLCEAINDLNMAITPIAEVAVNFTSP